MSQERAAKPRTGHFAWVALLIAELILAFAFLGSYRTLGTHEVVGVVPAREMLRSGDWIVPRYGDVPRTQKPPLLYWMVASSSWLFGEVNELTGRFHSALAFVGLTVLMAVWAARWYGREAAFGAAVIQATSFWAINFGHHAEVDMVMCLLTTAALFLIGNQPDGETRWRTRFRWMGIFALLGLTWLAKFHYGMTMVLGPVLVSWAIERQWRKWFHFVNPFGLMILLACMVTWPYLLLREYPEALERWRVETIGRAIGEKGYAPWWFYGHEFLLLALPWLGHFVLAVPQSWRRAWRSGDQRERFLWIWLAVDLVILSLSPNKHANYLLAVMPVTTLLASQTFARWLARIHRDQVSFPKPAVSIVVLSGVLAVIALGVIASFKWPELRAGVIGSCAILAGGLIAVWWSWSQRRASIAGWIALATQVGIFLVVVTLITPNLDRRRDTIEFAQRLRQEFLKDRTVCAYLRSGVLPGFHPAVYYLDEPVFQVRTFSELLQQVRAAGELLAVVERETLPRFDAVRSAVEWEEILQPAFPVGSREKPLACVRLKSLRVRNGDDTAQQVGVQVRR